MDSFSAVLPEITQIKPVWNGENFILGDEKVAVLQYSSNLSGWNDELTFFHENLAGDDHFIDRASRNLAIRALQNQLKGKKNPIVLEIGCSSGYFLKELKDAFPDATVVGADIVTEPLIALSKHLPGTPLLQFDLLDCPLLDSTIDAVVMLNVLEHIENDEKALSQVFRILKPNGVLVAEVPAGPHLYDIYDKQLLHYRRYSSDELTTKAKNQNFKIIKSSHLGFLLYPGFFYVKNKNKKLNQLSDKAQKEIVEKNIQSTHSNPILKFLMKLELFFYRFIRYPFGIRCTLVCQK